MTNKEAIERYLERVLQDTLKEQRRLKFTASGQSAAESYVEVKADGSEGSLFMPLYIRTNFKGIGRKPGEMPPIKAIEDWIKIKGIDRNPWAVAKNIAKFGNAVWQGKREGIDFKSIERKHIKQFKEDSARALKDEVKKQLHGNSNSK
jgi:hypothetical protein